MRKIKIGIVSLLLAITVLFALCIGTQESEEGLEGFSEERTNHETSYSGGQEKASILLQIPQHAIDRIKANRVFDTVNVEEIMSRQDEFFYKFESNEGEIPVAELKFSSARFKKKVSIEEAKHDVDHFFRLLKFGYAGYQFFGGDETFLKAKEEIIKSLEEKSEVKIRVKDLEFIICRELQFVQDGHFSVGTHRLMQRYNLLMSEEREFFKNESGYYTVIEGEKYILDTINNKAPEEYLKLSINGSGEIVYYIGIFCYKKALSMEAIVELENEKRKRQEKFVLLRPQQFSASYKRAYTRNDIYGMPLLEVRKMAQANCTDVSLGIFVSDAENLNDEEVIIVDLRGNSGGSTYFKNQWVKKVAGHEVNVGFVFINLFSNQTAKQMEKMLRGSQVSEGVIDRTKERFNINAPETERWITPQWNIQLGNNDIEVDNESIIIVLMDGKVASAAEDFIKLLRRFKRVVFVGENSGGASIIGNVGTYLLPNSNITVRFGFTMFEDPTKENKEGLGLSPDFWVAPEDALERAIKMIRKYDLEKMNITDTDS